MKFFDQPKKRTSWGTCFLLSAFFWVPLGLAAGLFVGVFIGAIKGEALIRHEQYERERQLVEPILRRDPAFADVDLSERSTGGIDLTNMLSLKPGDRSRLHDLIAKELGKSRADELLNK